MLTGVSRAPIISWLRERARLSFLFLFPPGRMHDLVGDIWRNHS